MISFAFILLCTSAVWAATEQRPGTTDELRTLSAAFEAALILAGLAWIL